jgi:hypothetical protein
MEHWWNDDRPSGTEVLKVKLLPLPLSSTKTPHSKPGFEPGILM